MDYLRKALEHRFWILVGIAVLLPTVGWAMVVGSLQDEANARESKLKGIQKKVSDLGSKWQPNQSWEQAVAERKEELKTRVDAAWEDLYQRQEPELTWPADVDALIQELGFDNPRVRNLYRDRYRTIVAETEQLAEPAEMAPNLLRYAADEWGDDPPETQAMLEAQEDIWVQRAVLKVVKAANAEAETLELAPIRSIRVLLIGDEVQDPPPVIVQSGLGAQRAASRAGAVPPARYSEQTDQYKLIRFNLVVSMDHRELPNLLAKFGSSPIPIEVTQVSLFKEGMAGAIGAGAVGDPMLAEVDIFGKVYLFNRPPSRSQ